MQESVIPYEKQIFVCTYAKDGSKRCGNDHQGESIFKELRRVAKERGVHPRIRVAQSKCLGQCDQGVNVMVYPDEVWYQNVKMDDVQILVDKYLK